jgi:hypothetical protein
MCPLLAAPGVAWPKCQRKLPQNENTQLNRLVLSAAVFGQFRYARCFFDLRVELLRGPDQSPNAKPLRVDVYHPFNTALTLYRPACSLTVAFSTFSAVPVNFVDTKVGGQHGSRPAERTTPAARLLISKKLGSTPGDRTAIIEI